MNYFLLFSALAFINSFTVDGYSGATYNQKQYNNVQFEDTVLTVKVKGMMLETEARDSSFEYQDTE